jgi:cation:H+ antiporter
MTVWLQFVGSAILIVVAAIKLAQYGDAIAVRTRLGGMFVGTFLLAGATSLPELLVALNSLYSHLPNLTAGDMFGSSMFNMLLLAGIDLLSGRVRISRRVAMRHALSASLAILLTVMVVTSLLADVDIRIGWVGLDSLLIIVTYVAGVRLLRANTVSSAPPSESEIGEQKIPRLWMAAVGFVVAAAVLVLVTPWLVRSSAGVAEMTGMTTGFVGTAFVAVITSLPELVSCIVAVRLGAYDLAVGNLFGSNIFNMFAIGLVDVFYVQGSFLREVDPAFALTGLFAMLLTTLGLIGNQAQIERRLLFVEIDALLIILVYAAGLWLLFVRAVGI